MDALVVAGGIPKEGEPLYEYTQGLPKALLDVGGKHFQVLRRLMVWWSLDWTSQPIYTVRRSRRMSLTRVVCWRMPARG